MAQLPKKITFGDIEKTEDSYAKTRAMMVSKINEIIDYLGELEGGKDNG